MNYRHRIG